MINKQFKSKPVKYKATKAANETVGGDVFLTGANNNHFSIYNHSSTTSRKKSKKRTPSRNKSGAKLKKS